ncbi:hypothetical protein EJ05DRAFT_499132 [Pseudovirgaria hyperparasitica]|uniref:Uncharacterized protein n=1 Tax=Pseudovirgaria hyperparasitica TaxID=470096 RepID=A0A6A6WAQ8_9PEZI|nr:uncharacterized protein EJ05DRAFT_499132 [Pseudovirgaria hyperparasitica]KAF2759942.1 hypothetical protein EJ05DRAFT_499132 [Pseudovirgaria hyperparasitica]
MSRPKTSVSNSGPTPVLVRNNAVTAPVPNDVVDGTGEEEEQVHDNVPNPMPTSTTPPLFAFSELFEETEETEESLCNSLFIFADALDTLQNRMELLGKAVDRQQMGISSLALFPNVRGEDVEDCADKLDQCAGYLIILTQILDEFADAMGGVDNKEEENK